MTSGIDLAALHMLGVRIIENPNLTQAGDPIQVKRTWRERLFTRPWQPLKRTKTVIPQVPYKGGYYLNKNTIMMHPAIARHLQRQLDGGMKNHGVDWAAKL